MTSGVSTEHVRFLLNQLRERLWVRPLMVCLLSIGAAFGAKLFDDSRLGQLVPEVTSESIEMLLSVMAASMLVIATFSVSSMVSAYAAASSTATPRSFTLVVADDASQNALSAFVGAFIFSIVALTAVKNDYYQTAGLFFLFVLTALVFSVVIFTFVRWVDGIARLGRIGSTLDKVEKAACEALKRRRDAPTLYGSAAQAHPTGQAVFARKLGYVQHIDMDRLQTWAEEADARVVVAALPGTFATPDRPLAYVSSGGGDQATPDFKGVVEVSVRLQKALSTLASIGDEKMRKAANYHRELALERSRIALDLAEDLATVRDAASFDAQDLPAALRD